MKKALFDSYKKNPECEISFVYSCFSKPSLHFCVNIVKLHDET